jgi:CRISPR type III-A-associated RAMP protein Csm4
VGAALSLLGEGDAWRQGVLEAEEPACRLSSLFFFGGRTLFVPPPESLWPPPASPRLRWKAARFVPISLVAELAQGKPLVEDRWEIDGRSESLISAGTTPPLRVAERRRAVVDRETPGSVLPHPAACLEFAPNGGLWTVAVFSSDGARAAWDPKLRAAFRLLADEGIGGERSSGWGRAESIEFQSGPFPQILSSSFPAADVGAGYWLLSLFSPAAGDAVDWTRGSYRLTERAARGSARVRMAAEGSVIHSATPPRGQVVRLGRPSREESLRAGFAVAVPLPERLEPRPTPLAEEAAG